MDRIDMDRAIYAEKERIAYITNARSGYIGIRYSGDIPGRAKGARITWGIGSV